MTVEDISNYPTPPTGGKQCKILRQPDWRIVVKKEIRVNK